MQTKKLDIFVDSILDKYRGSVPGASIGIICNDRLVFTKNYGYENLKTKVKISNKTNFRLASVSKQFIATCILQLVDKNIIKLEDVLVKYFPQFKFAKEVTIYHLLTHTSGLLDYEDLIRKNRQKPISDREILNLLSKQKKYKFEPGKSWSYNNGTYCILKELLEKVSGLSYANYLQKYIFTPLEMKTTILSERNKTEIKNRAFGYSKIKDKYIETDNDITSFTKGDGSIYSNIEDLAKWAFGREKLLSEKSYKLSQSALVPTNKKNEFYGLGLEIGECMNEKVVYHGGYTIGFRSSIHLILNQKIGIIFLSNVHKSKGPYFTNKIARFILENKKMEF